MIRRARWIRSVCLPLGVIALIACTGGGRLADKVRMVPQAGLPAQSWPADVTADGRFGLVVGEDDVARLFDLEAGVVTRALPIGPGAARSARFSPDGLRAVTLGTRLGTTNGELRLWDLVDGRLLWTVANAHEQGPAVAFSPDGAYVAYSAGKRAHLVDTSTGQIVRSFVQHSDAIRAIAFSPDGTELATGCGEVLGSPHEVRLWETESGRSLKVFAPVQGEIEALRFSATGERLLSGHSDGSVRVWDRTHAEPRHRLAPDAEAESLLVHDDGRASAVGRDGVCVVWDLETGARVAGPPGAVPRGAHMVAGSGGATRLALASMADGHDLAQLDAACAGGSRAFRVARAPRPQAMVVGADGRWAALALGGAGEPGSVQIFDLERLILRRQIDTRLDGITAMAVSQDQRLIAASDGSAAVAAVWSVATAQRVDVFREASGGFVPLEPGGDRNGAWVMKYASGLGPLAFGGPGTWLVSGAPGRLLRWPLASEAPPGEIPLRVDARARSGSFSLPGGVLAKVSQVALGGLVAASLAASADGRMIAAALGDNTVRVFDVESGEERASLLGHLAPVTRVAFSSDGGRLASGAMDMTVRVWELPGGRELRSFVGHRGEVRAVAFSPDGRRVVSGATDRSVRVWDPQSGGAVAVLEGHEAPVVGVGFAHGGRLVVSAGADGTLRVWRPENGASVALRAQDGEWIAYTDDGYFDASLGGGGLAAAAMDRRGFRVDQLAARANRPDLVLERLGLGAPDELAYYRALHQRRLEKLGLGEGAGAAGFADATRVRIIDVSRKGQVADVTFVVEAPGGSLLRYNVFADGVPLLGSAGRSVTGESRRMTERVVLASGRNRIEVGATNTSGIEALRAVRDVESTDRVETQLFFVGVGVSRYRDPAIPSLRYAHKDALDLAETLAAAQSMFARVHVKTFVNEGATADVLREARAFLAPAQVNDVVVLFVAGHGLYTRESEPRHLFLTHDTVARRLAETAVEVGALEDLLGGIAARRKLMLLDTCESGEREDFEESVVLAEAGRRGLTPRSSRGFVMSGGTASDTPRPYLRERERFIFAELTRRSGAVVFTSSRGNEASLEQDAIKNGVFTEEILRVLSAHPADGDRGSSISLSELRRLVSLAVSERTGGLQNPTMDRANLGVDLSLPRIPTAAHVVTRDSVEGRR